MVNLTKAHNELFRRESDECFSSFDDLFSHCLTEREQSVEIWQSAMNIIPQVAGDGLRLKLEDQSETRLNDWSFTQLCRLCGINRDTINRLSPETAGKAIRETLPGSSKPIQLLSTDRRARSVHGASYTRLWNVELLDVLAEFKTDFQPPQQASNGQGTGLYCGEQDLFAFLIDPNGWIDIEGEQFAPGFFVWNSEVGRRSLGIQTFWYQRICGNHIVWDAVDVVQFSRKHTAKVRDGLDEIRGHIEALVKRRDQRRDRFAKTIKSAMNMRIDVDDEKVIDRLAASGIPRGVVKDALPLAGQRGGHTVFAWVDALTRASGSMRFAGDRTELDHKIGQLLALAS